MTNLILFGFKGCGKTYWGNLLAQQIRAPFIDTDDLLEKAYTRLHGKAVSCRDIYGLEGEKIFRELEYEAVLSLQKVHHSIIAVGGGTVLNSPSYTLLKERGRFIYLALGKEGVRRCLQKGLWPAFLSPSEEAFESYYQTRKALYEQIPSFHLALEGKREEEVLTTLKGIWHGQ